MARVAMESPWLNDGLPEAIKSDQNFMDKCQAIATDIKHNNVKLLTLVERLGSVLTDPDPYIRTRATEVLAKVLQNLPSDFLLEKELQHIAAFFIDRLKDHHAVTPASLVGILSVAQMANAPRDIGARTCVVMFQHIQCQTLKPEDRRIVYKIFSVFIHNYTEDLKALGPDFVYGFMSAIDQEKDARNLMIVFGMVPFFVRTFSLGHLKEEMFEIISCYFPVDYRAEYADCPVTREDLAEALQTCLVASPDFAEYCIPLLVEKLDSKLKQAKLDSFKVLISGCEVFSVESIRLFLLDLWRIIQHEVLPGSDKEVRDMGLSALKTVVRKLSLSVNDGPGMKPMTNVTSFVLSAGINSLGEVELNLFLPAVHMMLAVAEATPSSCLEVSRKVVPILVKQYYKESGQEQKVTVLRALTSFVAVCMLQKVTPKEHPDLSSDWMDLPTLYLEAAQYDNLEVCKEGFHGLAVAAEVLDDNSKPAFYDLLNRSLKQKSAEIVRTEILACLKVFASVHTNEVLEKIVVPKLQDLKNWPENSDEEMFYNMDSLCEIAVTEPFTSFIVPNLMRLIMDTYCAVKCIVGMKCFRKLLELSSEESRIYKYLYAQCAVVSRFMSWWLQGVKDEKCSSVFENEEILLNTAKILDNIMKRQDSGTQREVISTLVSRFTNPNPCMSEGPKFKPLDYFSPWQYTQLVVLLEALIGSVHQDVKIPLFHKLVIELTQLAIHTSHHLTHCSAGRLVGNVINKVADDEHLSKLLAEICLEGRAAVNGSDTCLSEKLNACRVMVWVTKAVVMRGHKEFDIWVEELLELLSKPTVGMEAAQGFSTIMNQDEDYMNLAYSCNVKILYRQRFFSVTPKLVAEFRKAGKSVQAHYLVALGHLLQGVPKEVLLMDIEGMVPLLVESLQQQQVLLLLTTLDTLLPLLEESRQALLLHLQTFIPRILALTQFQESMDVRRKALQCMYYFSKYPTEKILPYKKQVLQVVGECLDDDKRLVRKDAVRARSQWFVVGSRTKSRHF